MARFVQVGEQEVAVHETRGVKQIETLVRHTLDLCKDEFEDVELHSLYVVGSYARGTATAGVSDLDIVVVYNNAAGDNMDPQFDIAREMVVNCLREEIERGATEVMNRAYDGYDVIHTIPRNRWEFLERFVVGDADYTIDGKPRVYDAINNEYITKQEIISK